MNRKEMLEDKRKKEAEGYTDSREGYRLDIEDAHLSGSGALEGMLLKMADCVEYLPCELIKAEGEEAQHDPVCIKCNMLAELDAWLGK